MNEYGYANLHEGFTADELNKTEMNVQIAKLQQDAGIKVTGTITGSTIVAVKSPRCGMKDSIINNNQPSTGRMKRYSTAGSRIKWHKNRLTWRYATST